MYTSRLNLALILIKWAQATRLLPTLPRGNMEMRFVQGRKDGIFNEIGWKIENWSLLTYLHRTGILYQLLERPIYNYV